MEYIRKLLTAYTKLYFMCGYNKMKIEIFKCIYVVTNIHWDIILYILLIAHATIISANFKIFKNYVCMYAKAIFNF